MKSGASESSYFFLEEYYKFPENIIVSHLPQELQQSNKPIKILWYGILEKGKTTHQSLHISK
jgi:hypothetical protein